MAEESALKIQLAKMQAEVHSLESEITNLQNMISRSSAVLDVQKQRAVSDAQSAFRTKQKQDILTVQRVCAELHNQASDLLDTFPGMKSKEYAGKYEIKAIEEKLQELYPEEFVSNYVCSDPIQFDTEGEAYSIYNYLERKVTTIRQGTVAASLFTGLNRLFSTICKDDGAAGKVALAFFLALTVCMVVQPFIFLTVFVLAGCASAAQGLLVSRLFRYLGSLKAFLNESYDEDIFQADKTDILANVDEFAERVEDQYIQQIRARKFTMSESVLLELEKQSNAQREKAEDSLRAKSSLLESRRREAQQLLEQLDTLQAKKKEHAKLARTKYISTVEWKHEWLSTLLVDITSDLRTVGTPWTQGNSLYFSKSSENLEQFWKLAVYQTMLKMPPDYCGQVVLDYKDMGSSLMKFTGVGQSLLTVCTDQESIDRKIERMQEDVQNRVKNILRSCDSIESFNAMMKEYGSAGEAYVIVHLCGLKSVDETMQMFLRNGPKIGYFFKLYATPADLKQWGKDFPLEYLKEFWEVAEGVSPRTQASIRRLLEASA